MKTLVFLLILAGMCISVPARASLASVFVGQSSAGSGNGSSCANQEPVTFFNTAGNWGGSSGQIGGGTVVHLCGTITSVLTPQASGSSGNPITVKWEAGASLQVCDTVGAIRIGGTSFFVYDLGANTTAIECPNNGTGLSTSVQAVGMGGNGSSLSNTEIKNGTIGPLYQYSGTGSDGTNSVAITFYGATGVHIHNLNLNNVNAGIVYQLGNGVTSTGNEVDHNTCTSTVGRCIDYSSGDGGAFSDTGGLIHDNDITFGDGWFSGATDATHIESIRSFNSGGSGSDAIVNLLIYNNFIHGTSRGDSTSFVFIPDGGSCPSTNSSWSGKIFNNVMVLGDTTTSAPGDGFILTQDCHHTIEIYSNTFDAGANGHSVGMICMEFEGTNTVTMKNNVCMNANLMIFNTATGITLTADRNDYFNVGTTGSNGWAWHNTFTTTLSGWQTATSQDANASTSNPGLNSNHAISVCPTSFACAVNSGGTNLTSLSVTALDTGAPAAFGSTGSCGSGCVARPSSGNWDIGAFPFTNTGSLFQFGVVFSGGAIIQ